MSELRILDHKVYNVKDKIYFVINSIDDPTGFILCYGEIVQKDSRNLNILYLVKLLRIFDSKKNIIQNFHMKRLRTFRETSKTYHKTSFNVIDIVDDIDFSDKLQIKMEKYLLPISSFLCHDDFEKANEIYELTKSTSKEYLTSLLEKFK